MVRVLLAGFGFMGRTHAGVLRRLPGVALCGVADAADGDIQRPLAEYGWEDCAVYPDIPSALRSGEFDVVDICLPTDMHAGAAITAFDHGCHVFCEKPIALTVEDATLMIEAARTANRQLMIGHCIRFWPSYVQLEEAVRERTFGDLQSLFLQRFSPRPSYSTNGWLTRPQRSLGAAMDLHIHDTDFLVGLLGLPRSVASAAVPDSSGYGGIQTLYEYDHKLVTAVGAWNLPSAWEFFMGFLAVFEHAAMQFDSRRGPNVQVLPNQLSPTPTDPGEIVHDGYFGELSYFFDCLTRGIPVTKSSGEEALESLKVVLAEIHSAHTRERVAIPHS